MGFRQKVRMAVPRLFAVTNAGWREAELSGRDAVTLDDLLVALLAIGGPAAELLARHGATVDAVRQGAAEREDDDLASLGIDSSVRPNRVRRTLAELFVSPREYEQTPQVQAFVESLPVTADEYEIVRRLLDHGSGAPAEALARAGVDVEGLRRELDTAAAPVAKHHRVSPVPGLLDGLGQRAVAVERFLPVPLDQVASAMDNAERVQRWFQVGDASTVTLEGDELVVSSRRGSLALRKVVDEQGEDGSRTIVWQAFTDPAPQGDPRGFYWHAHLAPVEGGTRLRLTRGFRAYGRLGRLASGLGATLAALSTSGLVQGLIEEVGRPERA